MQVLNVPTPAYLADEEFSMFRNSVGRFLDDNAPPEKFESWRRAKVVERDLWTKAGAAGLLGLSTSTAYGGIGGDFRHEAILIEEAAKRGIEGWGASLHNAIVMPYIEIYGTEDQKKRWLPKLARGDYVGAIAMTEPGTGSDLQAVKTSARKSGNHYVINGSKIGLEAADTSELFFNDVKVPTANLIGTEEGRGFYQLMEQLPQERLIIAVHSIAMIERALAVTIDYVKERKTFGRPIIDNQAVKFKLAECKTEATVARIFVNHCIEQHLQRKLDAVTASMAKYWITDLQGKIVDECLQLHGGYGYMDEYPIARMYKDARVARIFGGANEIMKILIARML